MLAILRMLLGQETLVRICISAGFPLLQGTALLPTPHFELGARSGSSMQQGSSGKLRACSMRKEASES